MERRPSTDLSDSYDEERLSSLKREVALPKSELFELVSHDDRLAPKLREFITQGVAHIEREQFYEAIVYLNEAEVTLEYAASCGRTIDRSLILATLHNLACVYQRIWELEKSADYIEGIIYNIASFLEGEERPTLTPALLDESSPEAHQLTLLLHNRQRLVSYYLEFCAVSSQLKRNENSLNAAARSLDILKEVCEELCELETLASVRHSSELERNMLLELRNIRDFKDEVADVDANMERFLNKAKKSINMFQKKIKYSSPLLDQKDRARLQEFSIGSVMQIYPVDPAHFAPKPLKEQLRPLNKLYKALYISIAHFTMATELRLINNTRYSPLQASRRDSAEFKASQLHHLISVITVALYVPYETVYFEHILSSYRNHYGIDLAQASQSTLSEELSRSIPDDEIHLEISSLYRKKNQQEDPKSTLSPSISPMQTLKLRNKNKHSKVSSHERRETNSIGRKCRLITDSQKGKKDLRPNLNGKSRKKSKSNKKKSENKGKEGFSSPISHRKSPGPNQLHKPPVPVSRSKSKSKSKRKSKSKASCSDFDKKAGLTIRSEQEYGSKASSGVLSRTNRSDHHKKSLRSSEKRIEGKRSGDFNSQELKYIKHGKSPNNLPKPSR